MQYTPKDIFHTPSFIDGLYNPECLLTEEQAHFMIELHNSK